MHQELMVPVTAGDVDLAASSAVSCHALSMFILKQTESNDIEAYLQIFKRK